MEALSASTKRSGWLRRLDNPKGLGLRLKSTQIYVEAANGELSCRSSPADPVLVTEQLVDCRVSTVTKKGLAHGLRVDLTAGPGGERSLILGCADANESSLWVACLQANSTFHAELDELRRAATQHLNSGFVPGVDHGTEQVHPDSEVGTGSAQDEDAELQRHYAGVLQLTVEQALDPSVLSATFRSSLQQVDKHTLKERHQELLAAKRYFERQHRGQREARRSQRLQTGGSPSSSETGAAPGWSSPASKLSVAHAPGDAVAQAVTQVTGHSSSRTSGVIPEHPALGSAATAATTPAGAAASAPSTPSPPRNVALERHAEGRPTVEGEGDGSAVAALLAARGGARAERPEFLAREWSVSDVRAWALSVGQSGQGSRVVSQVADALALQQVDGEALEAIPSYDDLQQIVTAGIAMQQTTNQQLGAIGVAGQAGSVLKLWRRLQTMREDGADDLATKRQAAAVAALQEVAHDTSRLEKQLAVLRELMTEEQERSQKMLEELSSLKNTTMQVAADAAAAAEGSHTSSDEMESDEDWADHRTHEYASSSAYPTGFSAGPAPQPPSSGTSPTYSSDELSSPTARSDWASEDGDQEGERQVDGQLLVQMTTSEMENHMRDSTRLEDPIAINELLLQSLTFGDELNDARVTLQARYADLVREQAMREAGGVKDLSNY
eukprot:COSAG02_NODE_4415_length_5383_cov_1116.550719_1_plen_670_part_00